MAALRVVLDANVYASALIQPKGNSGRILDAFLKQIAIQVVVSTSILAEVRRCLFYPRVRKRIQSTDADIEAFLHSIAVLSELAEPSDEVLGVVKADADDDKYLAVAVEGIAKYVVSGDRHLLDIQECEGIEIVTPAQFIRVLARGA